MKEHLLYLLLGSNLGKKKEQINTAVELIGERIGKVTALSSFYETEPWGFDSDDLFLNMAVEITTLLSPEEVIRKTSQIEDQCGRKRSDVYSSRTLDIDILFYDDVVLDKDDLKIPHPRLQERRFVLVPMAEIAPELVHPVFRKTMRELLQGCPDQKGVRLFEG